MLEQRTYVEREIKLIFDEARIYGIPQWNLIASRSIPQKVRFIKIFRQLRELLQEQELTSRVISGSSLATRLGRLNESYEVYATGTFGAYESVQVYHKYLKK